MAFPFFLQLFVMLVPKALNCDFAETEFTCPEVLAATQVQRTWAHEEVLDGGAGKALVDLLEQGGHPAGVYSILAAIRLSSGKDADTPSGPGEYWSAAEPVGEVRLDRLGAEDGLAQLEEMGVEVDDALHDLLFSSPTPDAPGVLQLT